MVEWLIEPLSYGFFLRGLGAGLMVALACGALSAFVVWRGMSFIGDALAHAILPGVVIAVILGINLLVGALASALLSVIAIGTLSSRQGFKEDTAIGVIFTGAFALGIVLMAKISSFKDLTHILFGNILGISSTDLLIILPLGLLVLGVILLFFKELLVTSFDATHATAIGLSPRLIHYGLLVLIAVTTVIAARTVGVILVLALLITPAACASLLAKTLARIVTLAILFAVLATLIGFYASYYLDLASGGTIVLVLTLFFTVAFVSTKVRDIRRPQ